MSQADLMLPFSVCNCQLGGCIGKEAYETQLPLNHQEGSPLKYVHSENICPKVSCEWEATLGSTLPVKKSLFIPQSKCM